MATKKGSTLDLLKKTMGLSQPQESERSSPLSGVKTSTIYHLNVDNIVPDPGNPRMTFKSVDGLVSKKDQEDLEALASSIKNYGVQNAITVRPTKDGKYMLIQGERRWRASKLAGMATIPAQILSLSEQEVDLHQIIENIQRADMNDLDIAIFFRAIMDEYNMSQAKLAKEIGKKISYVAQKMLLLNDEYRALHDEGICFSASVIEKFHAIKDADSKRALVEKVRERMAKKRAELELQGLSEADIRDELKALTLKAEEIYKVRQAELNPNTPPAPFWRPAQDAPAASEPPLEVKDEEAFIPQSDPVAAAIIEQYNTTLPPKEQKASVSPESLAFSEYAPNVIDGRNDDTEFSSFPTPDPEDVSESFDSSQSITLSYGQLKHLCDVYKLDDSVKVSFTLKTDDIRMILKSLGLDDDGVDDLLVATKLVQAL